MVGGATVVGTVVGVGGAAGGTPEALEPLGAVGGASNRRAEPMP